MTDTPMLDLEELKRLRRRAMGCTITLQPPGDPLGDYISAVVNSLPALIAEVERLRAIEKLWATAVAQP